MPPVDRYTCEQVFERLDDYLDRELSPEEMEIVREHLEICAWCASTYDFEAGVLKELRSRLQRVAAPAGLLAKISGALQQAQAEAPDSS
jgi:anti-sigma factor (TIGR02949 family)